MRNPANALGRRSAPNRWLPGGRPGKAAPGKPKRPGRSLGAAALALTLAAPLAAVGCAPVASTEAASEGASTASGIVVDVDGMDRTYTARDRDASYDEASATRIELAGTTARVAGGGAQADGSAVTITAPGTYVVSGELAQGQLVVELPGEEDKAQVVLAGASIRNEEGPALYVKDADKAFLTLAEGTDNHLADGEGYQLKDGSDEPYATLFSRADLTINGSGALTVEAAYRHGICSKDDLVVTGGDLVVSAPEDALRGRDCVKVAGGTFQLTAGEDAIKSNKDDDAVHGFVSLDGGAFSISAGDEAVHGETAVFAGNARVTVSRCVEGYEAQQVHIEGGEHAITASDDALNASAIAVEDTAGSAADAASQADETATSPNGDQNADRTLGEQDGQRAQPPEPPSAPEDAAGQAQGFPSSTAFGGASGANEDCLIAISGGHIVLDAGGDAVDSNGSLRITGGELYATGPSTSADAALDYEFEATVEGGVVLMVGPAGMAETFTGGSQPFALVRASGTAGDLVEVVADGATVASFTAARTFQAVNVSAPGLGEGQTCQLLVGGVATEFTASTTPSATGGPEGMGIAPGEGGPEGNGGAFGDGEPPEGAMPDGNAPEGFQPPDGEPPARPDGTDGSSGGERPAPPDGAAPGGGGNPGQAPQAQA